MKHVLPFLLILSVTSSGCWVFDELSAGEKEMERYSHQADKNKKTEKATAAATTEKSGGASDLSKWWQSATSLTPRDESSDLVRCRNGGSISFTREADCQAAGGAVID